MNPVAFLVWLAVMLAGALILVFVKWLNRNTRKKLADWDAQLAKAIGVGEGRETTDWLDIIKVREAVAGRHRT